MARIVNRGPKAPPYAVRRTSMPTQPPTVTPTSQPPYQQRKVTTTTPGRPQVMRRPQTAIASRQPIEERSNAACEWSVHRKYLVFD